MAVLAKRKNILRITVIIPSFGTFSALGGLVWYLGLRFRLPQAETLRRIRSLKNETNVEVSSTLTFKYVYTEAPTVPKM